jgi:hypothetical protein
MYTEVPDDERRAPNPGVDPDLTGKRDRISADAPSTRQRDHTLADD